MQKINKLQDIAIHLSWNLHSSARENIISSLLAASLSESKDFQDWFLDEVNFNKKFRHSLWVTANYNCMETIKKAIRTKKRFEPKDVELPTRPDIAIFDERLGTLKDTEGRNNLGKALRDSPLVIIEVKHTRLGSDAKKYDNLIEGLASFNNENTKILLNRHRFVIISSHTPTAKTLIIRTKGKNNEEKKWHSYFERKENDGVKHFTLKEIYDEIHNNRTWCNKCEILQLLEYYLAVHLGTFLDDDDFSKEYWMQVIRSSARWFDLKWEIATHINWIADNELVKKAKGKKWDEEEIKYLTKELKAIKFTRTKDGKPMVAFDYGNRSLKKIDIYLDGKRHPLEIDKILGNKDHGKIKKALKEIQKFISA